MLLQIAISVLVLVGLFGLLILFSLRKDRRIGCGSDCGR
jgi:hypothetical protein